MTQDKTPELKAINCAFCGGPAVTFYPREADIPYATCGMPQPLGDERCIGKSIQAEVYRWNTRTLKQPSSVEVTVEKKQYYRSREFYIEYFASVLCRMDDLDPKRWREGSETFEWTEFEQHAECILDAILQDFPSALRITRAAATDGVKS